VVLLANQQRWKTCLSIAVETTQLQCRPSATTPMMTLFHLTVKSAMASLRQLVAASTPEEPADRAHSSLMASVDLVSIAGTAIYLTRSLGRTRVAQTSQMFHHVAIAWAMGSSNSHCEEVWPSNWLVKTSSVSQEKLGWFAWLFVWT